MYQVDHGDYNPPWWTRSVQDQLGRRSQIFLMKIQERTEPHNNLVNEGPQGPTQRSRAGNVVLTPIATTTIGERSTPAIKLDKWEEKGLYQRTREVGNRGREMPLGHSWRGRGAKKPGRTGKPWKGKSLTSEANPIAPPRSLWQKTITWNDWTRKRKNSNKPRIEQNSECAKSGEGGGKKEFGIVRPMQEGEGS